ncbi:hypothetical protein [Sedimenticola sp.]|uniref:hypothetical protein n=1 Tax=Sedimenticola sp. TaxID=1940285 RepID=UPI003D0F07E7
MSTALRPCKGNNFTDGEYLNYARGETVEVINPATGEVAYVVEVLAGLAPSIEGNQQDLGGDFYYTRREPLGIGAWNYPLYLIISR